MATIGDFQRQVIGQAEQNVAFQNRYQGILDRILNRFSPEARGNLMSDFRTSASGQVYSGLGAANRANRANLAASGMGGTGAQVDALQGNYANAFNALGDVEKRAQEIGFQFDQAATGAEAAVAQQMMSMYFGQQQLNMQQQQMENQNDASMWEGLGSILGTGLGFAFGGPAGAAVGGSIGGNFGGGVTNPTYGYQNNLMREANSPYLGLRF